MGQRLGPFIDQNAVIRMHDRNWQHPADYGTRTDYTVIPGPWASRGDNPKFLKMFSEKNKPSIAWIAYTLTPRHLTHECRGLPVLWFDLAWFVELLKPERAGIIDVVPTRGAAAILIAMEVGATHIRMLGCDSIVSGRITEYARGAGHLRDPRSLGRAVNSRHDYERERDALNNVASKRGVTLEALLSQDVAA